MSQEDKKRVKENVDKATRALQDLEVGRIEFEGMPQQPTGGRILEPWMYGDAAVMRRISELERRIELLEELLEVQVVVEHQNCNYQAFRDQVCTKCGKLVTKDKVTRVVKYILERSGNVPAS